MAVYGDTLSYFPELFSRYATFVAKPKTIGGYEVAVGSERTITAVIQNTKGEDLKEESHLRSDADTVELWTMTILYEDSFVIYDEEWYKRVKKNSWTKEGGFNKYTLERVASVTNQTSDPSVDFGTVNYA